MTVLTGDCRALMPAHAPFDLILADPPYGDTSLAWDRRVEGWLQLARAALAPTGSLWVFGSPWRDIYNEVQTTPDATARTVRRKRRPPHTGHIDAGHYVSHDGGPRLMRSVIYLRNCHGRAIHPTEKPSALLEILIRTSCPPGGLVGDWFAGSGAAGEACRLAGRRYLGCEIDAVMAERARARIAAVLPFDHGAGASTPLVREFPTTEGDQP